MNITRLNHLSAILALVSVSKFGLSYWKTETTACPIGYAAQDPTFNEQGFYLKTNGNQVPAFLRHDVPLPGWNDIRGDVELTGWGAVCAFFELTHVQARHLFAFAEYPENTTPQDVIDRIRHLVANTMCVELV